MAQIPEEENKPPADGPHTRFEDPLLDQLSGEWRLHRRIGNRIEENRVEAEWILNHQFFRIHMEDVKSPPRYEALVLIGFSHEEARYVIYWLDTFGGRFSEKGTGTRDGDSIRFVFSYPDGLLHNTYSWDAGTSTWRSLIEQQDEQGKWSVFAEDTLGRR